MSIIRQLQHAIDGSDDGMLVRPWMVHGVHLGPTCLGEAHVGLMEYSIGTQGVAQYYLITGVL